MEGKTVILSVLIMSLVIAQIQVEAKSCCLDPVARNAYNICRLTGASQQICARQSRCIIISGDTCPASFPNENLENSGDAVNEYCNLGCAYSVCGTLTTLKNSADASEIVNEALENCTKACSTLCAKASKTALDQIA